MGNFLKNSAITFFTDISSLVLSFIAMIILTRVLGPGGKGIYSLILLIPGMMMTFGSFGLESANAYFIASKKYKVQEVFSNSLILVFLLGLILILVFFGIFQMSFFQNFINEKQIPAPYLWIVIALIPVSFLLVFFRGIIYGKEQIINYNKTKILENIFYLTGIIVFLLILKQGIFGAVSSYVISIIGATFLSLIFIKRITKFYFSFSKKLLKESAVYGGKVYLANIFSLLNYRLDMLLIAIFLAPTAVGFYSIAVGISERLFMIPGALSTVLFPKICSAEKSAADELTSRIIRHIFFIMIMISLVLAFVSVPLIRILFGSVFLPSVAPLIILLPGTVAFCIGGVIAADLSGRGKPQFAIYSSFACLIVNVALNIILIPKWGISGAAWASSVAYSIDTLVILIAFLIISKKSLSEVLLIKKRDFKDYLIVFSGFKNLIKNNL